MSKRLIAYVHIGGETYGPGDTVPADVAQRIGAHAWQRDTEDTELPDGTDSEAPPRSGRGSGRDAWAAYAEANGVHVAEDHTREQIITGLEDGGVIEREE